MTKLTSLPILLNQQTIIKKLNLPQEVVLRDFEIFSLTTSTIAHLENKTLLPHNLYICLAEQQTHGRGHIGHQWFSPFASNIYLSLAWSSQQKFQRLSKLSLASGMAVIKSLEDSNIAAGLKIKWPNDILWQNKKLAGILVDVIPDIQQPHLTKLILSVGLNVNMTDHHITQQNISQPWTSLKEITGKMLDRNPIAALLINAILGELNDLEKFGNHSSLALWPNYDALYNKEIKLSIGNQIINGIAQGIDANGHLKIQHKTGPTTGQIFSYANGHIISP